MSRVRLVASLVVACCLCVFLAPAAAKPPSLHWQLVGEPTPWQQLDQTQFQPRVKLAVANDVPYVASLDTQSRLTVWRPNRRETGWVQLGGPLNHDLSKRAREVSITTSGRTVWVAWDEHDLIGVSDVHLAKLVGDSFREVGVGTQLTGGGASVEIYGGRPYVAYGGAPVQVVRLSRDGRTFEHLDAPADGNDATLAVSGGRLWLVHESRVGGEGLIRVLRLDARRDRWQTILTRPGFNVHEPVDFRGSLYALWSSFEEGVGIYRITDAGASLAYPDAGAFLAFDRHGVPYTAFGVGSGEYEAPREWALAAFLGGEWQYVDSPIQPGDDADPTYLDMLNSNGTLWMIWESGHGKVFEPPRAAHVARLVRR
jgi:hypothetical protein